MHSHESKEEMKCCIMAHKKEIVACLAVMAMVKLVVIGLVCMHKHPHHHHGCCKPEDKPEE